MAHNIYEMAFSEIYPHYITKVTKKGRQPEEVLEVIHWLTGYTKENIEAINKDGVSLQDFYKNAPAMNPNRFLITGSICGVKVQDVEEPIMQNIRFLDKLVDDLAKGKAMEKILRKPKEV